MLSKYEPELFPTLTSNPNLGNTWVMFSLISNNSIIVYVTLRVLSSFQFSILLYLMLFILMYYLNSYFLKFSIESNLKINLYFSSYLTGSGKHFLTYKKEISARNWMLKSFFTVCVNDFQNTVLCIQYIHTRVTILNSFFFLSVKTKCMASKS